MSRWFTALLFFPLVALAQNVDVKNVDTTQGKDGETTTIEIRKGKAAEIAAKDAKWEVTDGESEISGDAGATNKDAKSNWVKACDAWKKELAEDNKDATQSKVLSKNCGKPDCTGDAGNKVCASKATYKIKSKTN